MRVLCAAARLWMQRCALVSQRHSPAASRQTMQKRAEHVNGQKRVAKAWGNLRAPCQLSTSLASAIFVGAASGNNAAPVSCFSRVTRGRLLPTLSINDQETVVFEGLTCEGWLLQPCTLLQLAACSPVAAECRQRQPNSCENS